MINTFGDLVTLQIFKRKRVNGLSDEIQRAILRNLEILHQAKDIKDVLMFPGNNLKRLKGGEWSINIYDEGKIYFEIKNDQFQNVRLKKGSG